MGENIEASDVEMRTQDDGSLEDVHEFKILLQNMESKLNRVDTRVASKGRTIYRVPKKIRRLNEEAYTPHVVSIGPFHYGDKKLESMEKLKLVYLKSFLEWTKVSLEFLLRGLKDSEEIIRQCYAETIELKSQDFVQMILADACFIFELFLRYHNPEQWLQEDPILSTPWLAYEIIQDLTLLENQLPFVVLEDLFSAADPSHKYGSVPSFRKLTFHFFDGYKTPKIASPVEFLHFTDLLRAFYLPLPERLAERSEFSDIIKHVYSAGELVEAGLKFKKRESKCVLDLQFSKSVLEMPVFEISDGTECHIRNLLAYEQCHFPFETYITDYIVFLDFLINNGSDVNILVDKGIIINWLGDNNVAAALVNNLGLNLVQSNCSSSLLVLAKELNAFYDNPAECQLTTFNTTRIYISS
ncbi:hypothetical protein O6P43_021481 [Quillaja saponaria]|uniref:Uncharacterized protein n=1 Tax=Quillaja saponaria TaxID=32244 RepID=A0AAD7LBR2_QUISA|nr:hypothetical protein O6P43_021481 [Quillaja saponaria]